MRRVTVGYQDACIHPLWLTNTGLRMARLFGAESLWVPDHYIGFIPAQVWKPEVTPAAKMIHSPDAFFDALAGSLRFSGLGAAGRELEILLPLARLSPREMADLLLDRREFLRRSWSCWRDGPAPCGVCFACRGRTFEALSRR